MTRSYFKIDFVTKCFSRNGSATEMLKNFDLALKGNCSRVSKPGILWRRGA
jgi:hypothetical protein